LIEIGVVVPVASLELDRFAYNLSLYIQCGNFEEVGIHDVMVGFWCCLVEKAMMVLVGPGADEAERLQTGVVDG